MRIGVVILTGSQYLVILQGGNWEMSLKNTKDIGNSRDKNANIGNIGNSQTMA